MPQYRQATRRFLATVLFTDIVGSTEHAAKVGDRAWRDLVEEHNAIVRRELRAFQGREMDTAGDGFFAVFETPERAVRAAESIISAVQRLGIAVRAGVHMGECEMVGGKVGGMTVTIGARIAALAGPGEVLVSGSVRDLMTGSDRHFEGGDLQELKGVADPWRVYRLVPEDTDGDAVASRRPSMVPLYTRRQKRRLLVTVAAVLALALALSGGYLLTRDEPEVVVGENAVGVLDGDTVTRRDPRRRTPDRCRRRRWRSLGHQLGRRHRVPHRPGHPGGGADPRGVGARRHRCRRRMRCGWPTRVTRQCRVSTRRPIARRTSGFSPGRPVLWWPLDRCG